MHCGQVRKNNGMNGLSNYGLGGNLRGNVIVFSPSVSAEFKFNFTPFLYIAYTEIHRVVVPPVLLFPATLSLSIHHSNLF